MQPWAVCAASELVGFPHSMHGDARLLTILLSYFPTLTVHLLPILSLTQLDTLPSQCELRLLRLQQRQRRVLERGRWRLFLIDYFWCNLPSSVHIVLCLMIHSLITHSAIQNRRELYVHSEHTRQYPPDQIRRMGLCSQLLP